MTPTAVELRDLASSVANDGANLAREMQLGGIEVAGTKSSAVDVVTEADRAVEALIRARITTLRGDDAILGEEGEDRPGTSGVRWVIDPIDGTVNYLYGIPAYAVSVAAVVGDPSIAGAWRPVAGAVVNPVTGERFTASLGGGARRTARGGDARTLRAGDPELGLALCGTGFGYDAERRRWQGEVLARLLPRVRDIRRLGSAALDLCRVADGSLDVYYERGLNPWDMAAGWLVAAEAGALVTDLDGGHPTDTMTLAGGPAVHRALGAVLGEVVAHVGREIDR